MLRAIVAHTINKPTISPSQPPPITANVALPDKRLHLTPHTDITPSLYPIPKSSPKSTSCLSTVTTATKDCKSRPEDSPRISRYKDSRLPANHRSLCKRKSKYTSRDAHRRNSDEKIRVSSRETSVTLISCDKENTKTSTIRTSLQTNGARHCRERGGVREGRRIDEGRVTSVTDNEQCNRYLGKRSSERDFKSVCGRKQRRVDSSSTREGSEGVNNHGDRRVNGGWINGGKEVNDDGGGEVVNNCGDGAVNDSCGGVNDGAVNGGGDEGVNDCGSGGEFEEGEIDEDNSLVGVANDHENILASDVVLEGGFIWTSDRPHPLYTNDDIITEPHPPEKSKSDSLLEEHHTEHNLTTEHKTDLLQSTVIPLSISIKPPLVKDELTPQSPPDTLPNLVVEATLTEDVVSVFPEIHNNDDVIDINIDREEGELSGDEGESDVPLNVNFRPPTPSSSPYKIDMNGDSCTAKRSVAVNNRVRTRQCDRPKRTSVKSRLGIPDSVLYRDRSQGRCHHRREGRSRITPPPPLRHHLPPPPTYHHSHHHRLCTSRRY